MFAWIGQRYNHAGYGVMSPPEDGRPPQRIAALGRALPHFANWEAWNDRAGVGGQILGAAWTPRRRGPTIAWILADLATLDLNDTFDIIAMAGNVLPFVKEGDRAEVVGRLEHHLSSGGLLIAGVTIDTEALATRGSEPPTAEDYLNWCATSNLAPLEAWSSWDRAPQAADDGYRVFVHQK